MPEIHPTAIVHASAEIARDVTIGPYTTIEAGVRIGAGAAIGAYVTLGERLVLGPGVNVFNYACLGTASQDKKHTGQRSRVEIGERTVIREFATVNRATREGGVTRVGRDVLLMAYAHVAHECRIGDGAVLVNAATLGGEVEIQAGAILSGLVTVHQFCRVGRQAIVGAGSKVNLDIPPYVMADGHPARPFGPNTVGLRRSGFTEEQILDIRRIYREIFNREDSFLANLTRVDEDFGENPWARDIVDFCRASRRGIARPRPVEADLAASIELELGAETLEA